MIGTAIATSQTTQQPQPAPGTPLIAESRVTVDHLTDHDAAGDAGRDGLAHDAGRDGLAHDDAGRGGMVRDVARHGAAGGFGPALDRLRTGVPVLAGRMAPTILRSSLAILFVWFGVLKLVGRSPVAGLLEATFPWLDPDLLLPALGGMEIALGLGLLLLRRGPLLPLAVAGHLAGTFVTFVAVPELMFTSGNPLLLTTDGEFVLKNLVLIGSLFVLTAASTPVTTDSTAKTGGSKG